MLYERTVEWSVPQHCGQCIVIPIGADIAKICVQRGPQRIIVVRADGGRQAAAQCIQTVPNQRGHQYRADAPFLDQRTQHGRIFRRTQRGVGDRRGQRPYAQRRRVEVVIQREALAVFARIGRTVRDQHQLRAGIVGAHQVAHKTLGAAAPAVQDVQQHRASGRHPARRIAQWCKPCTQRLQRWRETGRESRHARRIDIHPAMHGACELFG